MANAALAAAGQPYHLNGDSTGKLNLVPGSPAPVADAAAPTADAAAPAPDAAAPPTDASPCIAQDSPPLSDAYSLSSPVASAQTNNPGSIGPDNSANPAAAESNSLNDVANDPQAALDNFASNYQGDNATAGCF